MLNNNILGGHRAGDDIDVPDIDRELKSQLNSMNSVDDIRSSADSALATWRTNLVNSGRKKKRVLRPPCSASDSDVTITMESNNDTPQIRGVPSIPAMITNRGVESDCDRISDI